MTCLAWIAGDGGSAPAGARHSTLLSKSNYGAKLVNGCPGMGYADFERALLPSALARTSDADRSQVVPALNFAWEREAGNVHMLDDRAAPVKIEKPVVKGKVAQALKDPVVEQAIEENAATIKTTMFTTSTTSPPQTMSWSGRRLARSPLTGVFEEVQWRRRWVLANNGKDRKGLEVVIRAMGVRIRLHV